MYEIVPPKLEDAAALAALGAQTFAETFVGMEYYTLEIVESYTRQAFAVDVIRGELEDPSNHYFLLKVDGALAGYAKLVEREPPACVADRRIINLHRIYLAKSFHRGGLGTVLLRRALEEARRLTYPWLWLSVWEYNVQAVAFYQRHGFARVGEYEWAFEADGKRYADIDWVLTVPVPQD